MKRFKKIRDALKFLGLLVLVLISFCFAMIQGGFVSWFIFAAFVPLVLYSSLLFIYPVQKIQVVRELEKNEYIAGETVRVRLKITLPWRFPVPYLIIHDQVIKKRKKNDTQSWHTLEHPFFKKSFVCEYEMPRIRRGEFTFTDVQFTIADLFGFVRKSQRVHVENHIIVYPQTIPLKFFPEAYEFDYGQAKTKDMVQRDTTIAVSVREYQQGDRFSWINWKVTARKNKLMTKEFEQRKNQDVLFVLDRTPCQQFEVLVTFCASMIEAVFNAGVVAGLYIFGTEREHIVARYGETQRKKIFRTLARVEDDAPLELARVIQEDPLFRQHVQHMIFLVHALNKELVSVFVELARQRRQLSIYVIKDQYEQIRREEYAYLSTLKQKGITANILREGEFASAMTGGEVG